MSEKALVDTIKAVVDKQYAEDSENILISPGNYGREFCQEYLQLDIQRSVPVSNYIGEALDYIRYKGFKRILFVGHTGKLIKNRRWRHEYPFFLCRLQNGGNRCSQRNLRS